MLAGWASMAGLLPTPALHRATRALPLRCSVWAADGGVGAVLGACGADPVELAKKLTKEQLRAECERRSLRVSGTKAELAPRLAEALQAESHAYSPVATEVLPRPAVAVASPPPARATPPPAAATARGDALADRLAARLADAAGEPAPRRNGEHHRHHHQERPPRREAQPQQRRHAAAQERAAPESRAAPEGRAAPPAQEGKASSAAFDASESSGNDIELTVLGSGACNPGPARSASSIALRVRDSFWLFDVGEGTQVQLQRCMVRSSKIDKIFVTHAHGDHCFGLPGLLCLIARGRDASSPPLEIYGPAGLRNFLRAALAFTGTRMLPQFVVHEIHQIPSGRGYRRVSSDGAPSGVPGMGALTAQPWGGEGYGERPVAWGEQPGGRDLAPDADGVSWWKLLETGDGMRVRAAPLQHSVPCVGFVVEEDAKPGRLLPDRALPHLERNRAALREEWGVKDPKALFKRLTAMGEDEFLELPDGSCLHAKDVRTPPRRGRKVVVLGDCSDSSLLAPLGEGADLLVHEATNAYLPMFGDKGGYRATERETASHGHSTPQMAGRAAASMRAEHLLLTHFSQRYHPDQHRIMRTIASDAAHEARLPDGRVFAAHDSMTLPVWQPDRGKPIEPFVKKMKEDSHVY